MKYVLDASIALKWALNEADSPRALMLRNDFRRKVHQFLAPDLFPVEIADALTRAERKGILTSPQASILLAGILSTPPDLHSYLPLLARAVELSSQTRSGVYDCLYIALAERENRNVITADERLIRNLPGAPLIHLSSFQVLVGVFIRDGHAGDASKNFQ